VESSSWTTTNAPAWPEPHPSASPTLGGTPEEVSATHPHETRASSLSERSLPTSFIVLWEGKIASVARILTSKWPPSAPSSEKTRSLRQTASLFYSRSARAGSEELPERLAWVRTGQVQGEAVKASVHPAADLDEAQPQGAQLQMGHLAAAPTSGGWCRAASRRRHARGGGTGWPRSDGNSGGRQNSPP